MQELKIRKIRRFFWSFLDASRKPWVKSTKSKTSKTSSFGGHENQDFKNQKLYFKAKWYVFDGFVIFKNPGAASEGSPRFPEIKMA